MADGNTMVIEINSSERKAAVLSDEINYLSGVLAPNTRDMGKLSDYAISSHQTLDRQQAAEVRKDAIDAIIKIAPKMINAQNTMTAEKAAKQQAAIMSTIQALRFVALGDQNAELREKASTALVHVLLHNSSAVAAGTKSQKEELINDLTTLASGPDKNAAYDAFLCLNILGKDAITTPVNKSVVITTITSALERGDERIKVTALDLARRLGPEMKGSTYTMQKIEELKKSDSRMLANAAMLASNSIKGVDVSKMVPAAAVKRTEEKKRPYRETPQKMMD